MHPERGVVLQNHRYKLRSITNCCVGSEIVDWLLVQDKASSRMQATAIGQALVDAGFLECLSSTEQTFVDGYSLYRPKSSENMATLNEHPIQSESTEVIEPEDTQEPLWVRQIGMQEDRKCHIQVNEEASASYRPTLTLDSDIMDSFARRNDPNLLLLPSKRNEELSLSADLNSPNPGNALSSPTVPQAEAFSIQLPPLSKESRLLAEMFDDHVQRLMKQLLSWQGLSFSWADVLMPLVHSLAHTVRPDVRDDDDEMDIRHYIHIKKVPGGTKTDSRIVNGVVCSKNVANRSMPKWSHDPNILLLSSAIDYQRVESKLISLEPLMMQVKIRYA